ncbi:MAG: hypothetical protein JNM93_04415 [Bacteriovoracaceae bacterium]|nr:hypothetical protein [Bacteriovoracaceae bacterium]
MSDSEKGLGEILKKVVSTGVSAAFMTEEAVRNALKDLPLPKDLITGLLQNAQKTKEEFVASVKEELHSYLSKINVSDEIDKVLEKYDFEIQITAKPKNKTNAKSKKS